MQYREKRVDAMEFTEASKDACFAFVEVEKTASDDGNGNSILIIEPTQWNMVVSIGDWIVKDAEGRFWPCTPDVFAVKYEPVEVV